MTYKMNGFPQLGGDKNKKPKTLESKYEYGSSILGTISANAAR